MKYEIGGLKPPENMSLSLVVQSAPVWLTALHTADKTTYTKQAHANKWHICGNLVMAFWSVKWWKDEEDTFLQFSKEILKIPFFFFFF